MDALVVVIAFLSLALAIISLLLSWVAITVGAGIRRGTYLSTREAEQVIFASSLEDAG